MEEHAVGKSSGSSSMSSCLPLLVFQHHRQGQAEDVDNEMLMFSISEQCLHKDMERGHIRAGSSSMCWTTPQGWVLLLQDHDTVSLAWLWNPCTGDKLPLPDIAEEEEEEEEEHQIPYLCKCMLSHKDPAHPGCVVVLFSQEAPELWYCHTNYTSSWRHHTYDIGNYHSIPIPPPKGNKARRRRRRRRPTIKHVINDMASFQGKIYFSKSNGDMCAIDFSSCTSTPNHNDRPTFQKFNFRLVNLPQGLSSVRQWLVESQDQLFAVTIGFIAFNPNNIGAIEVHRMDCSSSTQDHWRRVNDIGDAVFLLDDASMAASCSASTLGLKPNQIFFMKNFMDDDGDLCIFDLEINSQEITRVHNHEDLILCRKPFWIVPPS